ncbi:acyl-CoA thioesterase [Pontibacter vulgaris]|uniref:acyl-CoA thioesterase n=1 Tax=Pontibacter vulgaris TaxID=2905679 RepID=UPI001FA6D90B|nr:acyl-CoA thioesterase [Pontibacter vulgaris]
MTTTPKEKVLESKALIRFEDCDPFGHLNNGRYIDYYLNAREDQLRDNYNLDIYAHSKNTGQAWVVASNQIAYLREVNFMETVTIKTSLRWYTDTDLLMEGQMTDIKTGAIKSVIWTRFTYIDIRKGGKAQHPDYLKQVFSEVALDGEGKVDAYFEDRVKELRSRALALS